MKQDTTQNFKSLKRDKNGRFLPNYITLAHFYYPHSKDKKKFGFRRVLVTEKNKDYIKGYQINDEGQFKSFLTKKIAYVEYFKEDIELINKLYKKIVGN